MLTVDDTGTGTGPSDLTEASENQSRMEELEVFTTRLQKELNSCPGLFLPLPLPQEVPVQFQYSQASRELTIEGVTQLRMDQVSEAGHHLLSHPIH